MYSTQVPFTPMKYADIMPPRILDILRGQARTTPVLQPPPTRRFFILPRPALPARRTPTPNPPENQRLWQRMFRLGFTDTSSGVVPMDLEPEFDPTALGLKEIGNLASWTVSTCKPGSGVEALRHEDTQLFWQYVVICRL